MPPEGTYTQPQIVSLFLYIHWHRTQQSSTMWMLLFAISPDVSEEKQRLLAQALFRRAFEIAPRVERMWLLLPPGEAAPEKVLTERVPTAGGMQPLWSPCQLVTPSSTEEGTGVAEGKSEGSDPDKESIDPMDPLASTLPMLSGWGLAQCFGASVLPRLITRRAREEDCDDVAPVFESKSDVTR